MSPDDLADLLARNPDAESLLLEHVLALTISGQARLLLPARPGEAGDPDPDIDRLARAIGRTSLALVRMRKLQAGPDLQSGDFIVRLPNRRRAGADLRVRWPGHPEAANDGDAPGLDVQIALGTPPAKSDVQIPASVARVPVQIPPGTDPAKTDVQIDTGDAPAGVQIFLGTHPANNGVQFAAAPRRRGAPPGNRNRLVHGRRSAAAVSARREIRDLVNDGARLLRAPASTPCPSAL